MLSRIWQTLGQQAVLDGLKSRRHLAQLPPLPEQLKHGFSALLHVRQAGCRHRLRCEQDQCSAHVESIALVDRAA